MATNLSLMKPMLRGSATISEVSSTSGKGSLYGDSQELKELVSILGLNSIDDLYQERVRVDRKKLESLMQDAGTDLTLAEAFFKTIMEETITHIVWPCKLKIGAKSKKDPRVRISGRPQDVAIAKEKVLSRLEIEIVRVTMKIDVSYTDHSHIIGKGGKSIKQVMEETQCHIHFPDSNRSNAMEKSNQVSIAGDVQAVENARASIRRLIPLIFSFEMPILSSQQMPPDVNSSFFLQISQKYNVQIMLRSQPKLHATLIVVKGCEWEVNKVKQATLLLIKHICEPVADQILVQMSIEISPMHHQVVRGRNSANIKTIMQKTGTEIRFPEISDPNVTPIKKSNVVIVGGIHNVYLARQQLLGSLPVVLMFDLPENAVDIRPERLTQLMSSLNVLINTRTKARHSILSVVIKGIERNVANIYEARHQLLKLNQSQVTAQIPPTYFIKEIQSIMSPNSEYINNTPNQLLVNSRCTPPSQVPPSLDQLPVRWAELFNKPATPSSSSTSSSNTFNTILSNTRSLGTTVHQFKTEDEEFMTDLSTLGFKDSGFNSASSSCRQSMSPTHNLNSSPTPSDTTLSSMFSGSYWKSNYDQRRIAAYRAINSPLTSGECRFPNSSWSGYGLSATSPGSLKCDGNNVEASSWLPSAVSTLTPNYEMPSTSTNFLETSNTLDQISMDNLQILRNNNWQDLTTLLTMFGLDRYCKLFKDHEICLDTFMMLTDQDLTEIGVTAFGARRKIQILIAELKRRSNVFCGSVAPGAERKITTQF